ncbi:MAG: GNAT family N-acetyltransferase [Planctomycetales bacterium]|nr:GNAT family N-acetyltransferase [Planctomycetales bacterium]
MDSIILRDTRDFPLVQLVHLYRDNEWSSAEKPERLQRALAHSHTVISAWDGERLVGLGNAISDGYLVVYYPHLLVLRQYHRQGIGTRIMQRLQAKYAGLHQQVLLGDHEAVTFYQRCGFRRAGRTEPMWIYDGNDH